MIKCEDKNDNGLLGPIVLPYSQVMQGHTKWLKIIAEVWDRCPINVDQRASFWLNYRADNKK